MGWLRKSKKREKEEQPMPLLFYVQQDLEDDQYAVVRATWYTGSKVCSVSEYSISIYDKDAVIEFLGAACNALHAGADVSVVCIEDPANLGLHSS